MYQEFVVGNVPGKCNSKHRELNNILLQVCKHMARSTYCACTKRIRIHGIWQARSPRLHWGEKKEDYAVFPWCIAYIIELVCDVIILQMDQMGSRPRGRYRRDLFPFLRFEYQVRLYSTFSAISTAECGLRPIDFCQFFGGEAFKVYKRNQHRPANQLIIELEQSGKAPKAMRHFTFVCFVFCPINTRHVIIPWRSVSIFCIYA